MPADRSSLHTSRAQSAATATGSGSIEPARLDKWLWCVRIFKTRGLATAACRAGSVSVNGQVAKPSRDLRTGELISVVQGLVTRTLHVLAVPPSRVGAKVVAQFCDDRTPPEEFAKGRASPVQQFLSREKGLGRPTKRDRRARDRFLVEEP